MQQRSSRAVRRGKSWAAPERCGSPLGPEGSCWADVCIGPQVPDGAAAIWSSVMRCAGFMVSMPSSSATSGAESGLGRL
eukprot:scaffold53331_cov68-Phaeocystis_antarctica.AAC.9